MKPLMTDDHSDFHQWAPELSEREVFFVGTIVVQWGSLEHEVFIQTLASFYIPDGQTPTLPKAMNNLQFTEVVRLWKERVVDKAKGKRATVLKRQYDEINDLKQYRDALAHGLWEWSAADLSRISTIRVKKKEVITTHFTAQDLENFSTRLASINFKIRFPGGLIDLARAQSEQGFYMGRGALSMLAGVHQTEGGFPQDPRQSAHGTDA